MSPQPNPTFTDTDAALRTCEFPLSQSTMHVVSAADHHQSNYSPFVAEVEARTTAMNHLEPIPGFSA